MSATAEDVKALSDRIIDLLPDDPRDAMTALAINYACVACCTKYDDDSALRAIRRALRQMRAHGVGAEARRP